MLIDCNTCEVRGRECGDCVVSFLTIEVRPTDRSTVEIDDDQAHALDALSAGGLVPPLRLVDGDSGSSGRRGRDQRERSAS